MKVLITTALCCGLAAGSLADAALDRMKAYAVDRVIVSENERQHLAANDKSTVSPGHGKFLARSSEPGGGFSYTLKCAAPDVPQLLHVRYSGDEQPPARQKLLFNIMIDNHQLATQGINRNFPNRFIDEYYPIPSQYLKNGKVTISFAAYDKNCAVAGVYAVSILREKTRYADFGNLTAYQGLEKDTQGFFCDIPGKFSYTEPDGPRSWHQRGWKSYNDSVFDMWKHYGLELEVELDSSGEVRLDIVADMIVLPAEDRDAGNPRRALSLLLTKTGKQSLIIRFDDFANPTAHRSGILEEVKKLTFITSGTGRMRLLSVRLLDAYPFSATSPRHSQPARPDSEVHYQLKITNTGKSVSGYSLSLIKRLWEAMPVRIEPAQFSLKPMESKDVSVFVKVPARIPPGGHEKQQVRIVADGDFSQARDVEFITFAAINPPYILHDTKGWDEIRRKAREYDWAKKSAERHIKNAREWKVPEPAVFSLSADTKRPYLFHMSEEKKLMDAAIAWQLTRDKTLAEKAALFLKHVSDPQKGFPHTRQVGHQSEVQEGHMFQHIAQAYDLIRDSGVLSPEDSRQIEDTLQLYCDIIKRHNSKPSGANWALSTQTGAFFCALALQDLEQAGYFINGPGMIEDKLRSYTMSDGWWYECSISYNLWCAEEFVQIALAWERFGYSMLHNKFHVNYANSPDTPLPDDQEEKLRNNVHYGHSFRIFGNIENNTVTIKKMFDAMIPYIDYRGWIFGINDSYETNVGGGRFELAYYAFRDPRYASFIKRAPERDNLLYGVPELPENTPEPGHGSAYSDNAGLLMLRSKQQEGRERIQAVLKYGTHGGYHGHYDRTGLLSLMRYGRSFFNPEMVWYSYQPFMYNFYVQSSVAKNMVTVDRKQQEVTENSRSLFHDGKLFQAGIVETTARWSNPAYGGLRWGHIGFPTFSSKARSEGRFVPIPSPEPRYGSMSDFSEPILQRRAMILTDDYLVLADYVAGKQSHTYEQLFQIKGLLGLEAPELRKIGHSAQWDPDPLKSAQFVTDVNTYEATGTLLARFLTKFGPGADNRGTRIFGEDGDLYLNVYYAWPAARREAFTGIVPENHSVARKLLWQVKGDGKMLANGDFGAWILGSGKVDVDLRGIESLELLSSIDKRGKIHTLFWADAVIETGDGKIIPLKDLPHQSVNVLPNKHPHNQDFEGGKINIAGLDYSSGLSAEPDKTGLDKPASHSFLLKGLNAVRLKAVIGGDYPVGPENERRVTIGVRQEAPSATFLTVIEPFEKEKMVESVSAASATTLTVTLRDGRSDLISIEGLESGNARISVQRSSGGKITTRESSDK